VDNAFEMLEGNDNTEAERSLYLNLRGAEHNVIGLSPHYWAYIPFLIVDINRLAIVHDVFCVIATNDYDSNQNHDNPCVLRINPVSRCKLVGIVVGIDKKSSGLTTFVIDDGTGLIDCLMWPQSNHSNLPTLMDDELLDYLKEKTFLIGDCVRVYGTIRAAAISGSREDSCRNHWKSRECVHELNVSTIQQIDRNHSSCRYNVNPEYEHWIQCRKWKERYEQKSAKTIYNGFNALQLVGADLVNNTVSPSDFPSADDHIGAWRVFGTDCHCNLPYREELLYCHCQATVEPLDPNFLLRDSILMKLIHLQNKTCSQFEPLNFAYSTLLLDSDLESIAHTLGALSTCDVTRLMFRTFAALRRDGILYLFDNDTDRYILITRTRIYEPYILQYQRDAHNPKCCNRQATCHPPPNFFFTSAPYLRLQLVRRTLMKRNEVQTSK
jgi:hypothetical protein